MAPWQYLTLRSVDRLRDDLGLAHAARDIMVAYRLGNSLQGASGARAHQQLHRQPLARWTIPSGPLKHALQQPARQFMLDWIGCAIGPCLKTCWAMGKPRLGSNRNWPATSDCLPIRPY
jgi:hypothetical protein